MYKADFETLRADDGCNVNANVNETISNTVLDLSYARLMLKIFLLSSLLCVIKRILYNNVGLRLSIRVVCYYSEPSFPDICERSFSDKKLKTFTKLSQKCAICATDSIVALSSREG